MNIFNFENTIEIHKPQIVKNKKWKPKRGEPIFVWNVSAVISGITAVSEKNDAFLDKQSDLIRSHLHLSEEVFNAKFADFRSKIISRGELEISYWKAQIELIKNYTREQAIRELLTSMKLNEKIASIKKFIDSLRG